MGHNGWRYAVVIFYGLKERIMKQRNLIDYTVWLQQKGFIKSDVVIEALTSEYAEQLSTEAVKNNAVLPLVVGRSEQLVCDCPIPNTTMELPHRCVKCNKPIKWE